MVWTYYSAFIYHNCTSPCLRLCNKLASRIKLNKVTYEILSSLITTNISANIWSSNAINVENFVKYLCIVPEYNRSIYKCLRIPKVLLTMMTTPRDVINSHEVHSIKIERGHQSHIFTYTLGKKGCYIPGRCVFLWLFLFHQSARSKDRLFGVI